MPVVIESPPDLPSSRSLSIPPLYRRYRSSGALKILDYAKILGQLLRFAKCCVLTATLLYGMA